MTAINSSQVAETIARRQDELVRLLQALIRIPSESDARRGQEGPYQRFVADRLRGMDIAVDLFAARDIPGLEEHPAFLRQGKHYANRPTIVGKIPGHAGAPSLLLTAHGDTVSAGDLRQWTKDPWGGELEDGRIYGRGATDDKEGMAALLIAVQILRESGYTPPGDLYLASTIDEENGYGNGMLMLAGRGYRPDSVLYLDGCDLALHTANMGGGDLFVTLTPRPTAQGQLWQVARTVDALAAGLQAHRLQMTGNDALYRGSPFLRHLFDCFPMFAKTLNRPHAHRALQYNFKVCTLPGESDAEIKALTERWFREGLANFDVRLTFRYPNTWFEASVTPSDHPLVRALGASFERITGRPASLQPLCKVDSYILRNHYGIPVVNFGTGKTNLSETGAPHGPDEYEDVGSLMLLAQIVADLLLYWPERSA
ncbi:MAG: M20 family metallopeptidase [Armatimonadota bacterium]